MRSMYYRGAQWFVFARPNGQITTITYPDSEPRGVFGYKFIKRDYRKEGR